MSDKVLDLFAGRGPAVKIARSGARPGQVRLLQTAPVLDVVSVAQGLVGAFIKASLPGIRKDDLRTDTGVLPLEQVPLRGVRLAFGKGNQGIRGYGFEYTLAAAFDRSSSMPAAWVDDLRLTAWTVHRKACAAAGIDLADAPELLRVVVLANHHHPNRWPSRVQHLSQQFAFTDSRLALAAKADSDQVLNFTWLRGQSTPVDLRSAVARWTSPRQSADPDDPVTALGKADLLVGGVAREDSRVGMPWTAVSVKEKAKAINSDSPVHWAIARANARREHGVRVEHKGDLPVVRVPANHAFLKASDLAYWALATVCGSEIVPAHRLADVSVADRTRAQKYVRAVLHEHAERPAMEVADELLSGVSSVVQVTGLDSALRMRAKTDRSLPLEILPIAS